MFRRHGILPDVYYNAPVQKRIVYRAFVRQEAEDIEKEFKELEDH